MNARTPHILNFTVRCDENLLGLTADFIIRPVFYLCCVLAVLQIVYTGNVVLTGFLDRKHVQVFMQNGKGDIFFTLRQDL